ncbi:MAG: tyrosine-type recombinase/integrase [Akkermansia sp.]|nr:tyrosine-type recombinase/integrase [Akkermansia sp.]
MNTQREDVTREELAALEILKSTGAGVLAAAQVASAALKVGRGRVKRAMKCVVLGEAELKKQERTVTFEKAVEAALQERAGRRARTLCDFRYITRRFMKRCRGLAKRRVRAITTQECAEYMEMAFDTPSQRAKARRVLSGVFSTALKRGWCSENPVAKVEPPRVVEKRIEILKPKEIESLLIAAEKYEGGSCLAAVGMMLYAGIRPHEVARLTWEHVDLENKSICILPQHSKTGGARLVSIQPPLLRLLQRCRQTGQVCPSQWLKHWRALRKQAGFTHWQPDVLRHTFASYHLRHFKDYSALQYETGHRDSSLLRTRYVDMRGVAAAADFWR